MLIYILKLVIMLPIVAGLAWGSLYLWRKSQTVGLFQPGAADRSVSITQVLTLGTQGKLVVLDANGRKLLVGVTRGQIALLDANLTQEDVHASKY